jgi:hypothetical protein
VLCAAGGHMDIEEILRMNDIHTDLVESNINSEIIIDDGGQFVLDILGKKFTVNFDAKNELLNIVKIPIKYIDRLAKFDNDLASKSVNLFIQNNPVKFLIEKNAVVKTLTRQRVYVPLLAIHRTVIDTIDATVDKFNLDGRRLTVEYNIPTSKTNIKACVNLMIDPCFNETPRFDSMIKLNNGGVFLSSIEGRKFRTAGVSIPEILEFVGEFVTDAADDIGWLLEEVESAHSTDKVEITEFVYKMCSFTKISQRKVGQKILEALNNGVVNLVEAYHLVSRTVYDLQFAPDITRALLLYMTKNLLKGGSI